MIKLAFLNRKNKGITLTELMLAVGLIFFILGAVFVVEQTGEKFFESVSTKASLQSKANYALGMMVRCIQESSFQESHPIGGGDSLSLRDTDGNSIVFSLNLPGGGGLGEILYTDTRYGINSMKLVDGVVSLRFRPQGKSVRIEIELEQKNRRLKLYSQATFRTP